jgi:uncharacterized protein (TIGR00725 family)
MSFPEGRLPLYAAVIGPGGEDVTAGDMAIARRVGSLLADRGAVVVCGGLTGVMEAVCEGSAASGGLTVGLLPGSDRSDGNRYLSVVLPTGMGELRNGLVVNACDVVIAIGGSWGTLSEVSLAARARKPVVLVGGWVVEGLSGRPEPGVVRVASAEDAVEKAVELATAGMRRGSL